jgi:molybdenum cofactor cytidylyltransferase
MRAAMRMGIRVGTIILAAGASRRLGAPKQAAMFRGRSLLRRAAETALASPCRPVVAVLGCGAELHADELAELPIAVAVNTEWQSGIASSIRTGIAALESEDVDGAVVMLCDQPLVSSAHIAALAFAFAAGKGSIVATRYAGTAGVPALFSRAHFAALKELSGDEGAKKLLTQHRDTVYTVQNESAAVDIDTADDLARLDAYQQDEPALEGEAP